MRTRTPVPFNGGLDQSVIPLRQPKGFYKLENFRHDPTQFGRLVQTEYFRLANTYNRGIYWDGAAGATEPSASAVRYNGISSSLTLTDYCMWDYSGSQTQILYQSSVPAAETIYTGCRLKVNNITALGINLGSTLDVEMTGAAAFRWRKNGGGWTAGVPAITGVSIDGGNATLYFLANTGFAGTEVWAWRRTDCTFDNVATVAARPVEYCYYKNIFYFSNHNQRIMLVENSTTGQYCISVGYRPVYGTYLTVFEDHLILAGFSKTAVSIFEATKCQTIGWSDVTDIHNFIPTDTNEADQYTFPGNLITDSVDPYTPNGIIKGVAVVQQRLFVFTMFGIFYSDYLGLPVVFSFKPFAVLQLVNGESPIIPAAGGVYIVTVSNIAFFDGSRLDYVGSPITNLPGSGIPLSPVFGYYNTYLEELILVRYSTLYCYQAKYGTWFTRSADFSNDVYPVTCITAQSHLVLGGVSRKLYSDQGVFGSYAPVFDTTDGTVFATPKVTTQVFGGLLAVMKEIESVYLGAAVIAASATNFSTSANLQYKIHWYLANDGQITGTPSTDANAVWVNTNADGMISLPRTYFRGLALEVQLVGLSGTKPPGQAVITALEPLIRDPQTQDVER